MLLVPTASTQPSLLVILKRLRFGGIWRADREIVTHSYRVRINNCYTSVVQHFLAFCPLGKRRAGGVCEVGWAMKQQIHGYQMPLVTGYSVSVQTTKSKHIACAGYHPLAMWRSFSRVGRGSTRRLSGTICLKVVCCVRGAQGFPHATPTSHKLPELPCTGASGKLGAHAWAPKVEGKKFGPFT